VSGTEVALIITALATLVSSVGALLIGLRNSRKIEEVHKSTNGKMDQLVTEVRNASFAKGQKDQKDNPQ
jgi:hypothetical protein